MDNTHQNILSEIYNPAGVVNKFISERERVQ